MRFRRQKRVNQAGEGESALPVRREESLMKTPKHVGVCIVVGLALSAGLVSSAAAHLGGAAAGTGSSEAVKACQKGGWKNLVRSDGSGFKTEGDCVSYVAQGGTPTPPKSKSQVDCESYGGTFSTDPSTNVTVFGSNHLVWTCNGWAKTDQFAARFDTLTADCAAYDPAGLFATGDDGFIVNSTCFKF
jgi:hypothetical protein